MGQNIRNFNSWQKVNEEAGYWDWIAGIGSGIAAAVTGTEQKPQAAKPTTPNEPDKKEPNTDKTNAVEAPRQSTRIEDKPYTSKLQSISKKLGGEVNNTIESDSKLFISLDLSKSENVDLYGDICQEWLDIRKPLVSKIDNPITGKDFAEAAKYVYQKTGVYVPPQLVLAQATLEGGFAKEANKPIKTKNLFNVGNTDDGSIKSFDDKGNSLPGGDPNATWKGGIIAYFNLLADRYLIPGRITADDLVLGEFVNVHGNRYASSKEYEKGLLKLIDDINTRVVA